MLCPKPFETEKKVKAPPPQLPAYRQLCNLTLQVTPRKYGLKMSRVNLIQFHIHSFLMSEV